jgi:hypothetical protein
MPEGGAVLSVREVEGVSLTVRRPGVVLRGSYGRSDERGGKDNGDEFVVGRAVSVSYQWALSGEFRYALLPVGARGSSRTSASGAAGHMEVKTMMVCTPALHLALEGRGPLDWPRNAFSNEIGGISRTDRSA